MSLPIELAKAEINQPDLEHDVLVRDEPLLAVDRTLPPVVGHLLVQDDGVALVEVDLTHGPRAEVVQRLGLQVLELCKHTNKNV